MEVEEKKTKWKSTHEGKSYYFCAPGCKTQFDKNPKKFAK
jgi:YHS domain-containing protein